MARSEKLLKITKVLIARRNELRKRLGVDLLALDTGNRGSGDIADVAFRAAGGELASQLVEYESAELAQIELALTRLKQGRYGVCDVCERKIPAARLNAVPYSVMCVGCQEEAESNADWIESHSQLNWGDLHESERELDYTEVQVHYGK